MRLVETDDDGKSDRLETVYYITYPATVEKRMDGDRRLKRDTSYTLEKNDIAQIVRMFPYEMVQDISFDKDSPIAHVAPMGVQQYGDGYDIGILWKVEGKHLRYPKNASVVRRELEYLCSKLTEVFKYDPIAIWQYDKPTDDNPDVEYDPDSEYADFDVYFHPYKSGDFHVKEFKS